MAKPKRTRLLVALGAGEASVNDAETGLEDIQDIVVEFGG